MANAIDFDVGQEALDFQYIPADTLTRWQFSEVQHLRRQHYVRELQELKPEQDSRSMEEIGHFLGHTTLSAMRDLNVLVANGDRNAGQRYSRQGLVLVTDGADMLRAGIRVEDNVSSSYLRKEHPSTLHRIIGNLELTAKLYLPFTIGKEYLPDSRYWVFEELFHDGTLDGIEHVLAAVAIKARSHRGDQGVSAWPFKEEAKFRSNLTAWGLSRISNEDFDVAAFGKYTDYAVQEHWKGLSLKSTEISIHAVEGVSVAVDQAMSTMNR